MLRKFIAISMVLVIIIMTSGFTVSSHLCGGKKVKTVVDIAQAEVSCGMEQTENKCNTRKNLSSNCCQDLFLQFKIDENSIEQDQKSEFGQVLSVTLYAILTIDDFSSSIEHHYNHNYAPPPLTRYIPTLIQSFLI